MPADGARIISFSIAAFPSSWEWIWVPCVWALDVGSRLTHSRIIPVVWLG